MAKQSFKTRVNSAVVAYAKGSRKLVELFEEAAKCYWNEDQRRVDNLSHFLNAIKDFPVLQKAAVESTRTFGKFALDLKDGVVIISNKGKVSDEQKATYEAVVDAYIAMKYNSLLAAHQEKLLDAFDLTKRLAGFENAATALVVNALANEATTSKEAMIAQLKAVIDAIGAKDLSDKIAEKRTEIEASKITGEQIAAAANTEATTENVA